MKKAWASEGEALHKRHGREFAIPLAQIAYLKFCPAYIPNPEEWECDYKRRRRR